MKSCVAIVFCAALMAGCASSGMGGNTTSSSGMRAQSATDDATITARVKTVLLNDPQINATKIDVTTSGGVVTMSGTVKAQSDVERAVQLARGVEGVRDVKANLQIGS